MRLELNFASVKNVRPDLGGGVHVGNPSACGAEARELGVQRHLGLHDTLSPKHKTKPLQLDMVANACNVDSWETEA